MQETLFHFLGQKVALRKGIGFLLEGVYRLYTPVFLAFPGGSDNREYACNEGDLSSNPWVGMIPGGGHGNPLQYSCLENPHGQRTGGQLSIGSKRVLYDWATKHSSTEPRQGDP